MENFPVAATAKNKSNIPLTQQVSHSIQPVQESMSADTQLGTYVKFTQKQKTITLAMLHDS